MVMIPEDPQRDTRDNNGISLPICPIATMSTGIQVGKIKLVLALWVAVRARTLRGEVVTRNQPTSITAK
eukprot:5218346-Amphidinium_carterae.1